MEKGQSLQLSPKITPSNSTQGITYTSSNKKIATISSKGVITAKKVGTVKITVKSGNVKFVTTVNVKNPPARLNKSSVTITVNSSENLKVTNSSGKIIWNSSNPKVASVNSKGKVTGQKKGTATITATVGGKSLKCKVTVKNKTAAKPKFTTFMSSKADPSTRWMIVYLENKGDKPLRVFGKYAKSSDRDYESYDRDLTLYKQNSSEDLVRVNYIDIKPGKSAYVSFYTEDPTWYDSKTTVYYYIKYDDIVYNVGSSSYYGTFFEKSNMKL